jgi:hypothetical protein
MDWIESRVKERADRESRASLIEESLSDIWKNLQAAVKDSVKAYQAEAARTQEIVRTNGQEYVTIVVYRESNRPFPERDVGKVTATLDRNKPEISVAYQGKPKLSGLKFTFDVRDGVPCLVHEGEATSSAAAARLMLDPFLFPDLKS